MLGQDVEDEEEEEEEGGEAGEGPDGEDEAEDAVDATTGKPVKRKHKRKRRRKGKRKIRGNLSNKVQDFQVCVDQSVESRFSSLKVSVMLVLCLFSWLYPRFKHAVLGTPQLSALSVWEELVTFVSDYSPWVQNGPLYLNGHTNTLADNIKLTELLS